MRTVFAVCALLCALTINAEARQRSNALHPHCGIWFPCVAPYASTPEQVRITRGHYIARQMGGFGGPNIRKRHHRSARRHQSVSQRLAALPPLRHYAAAEILPHPSGCPGRSFCGCGAAVKVFGSPIRSLWLAANWYKFPRTQPAAGMVAVRRHHVFVLEAHLGGSKWLAYDANSGRHLTQRHARSIRGYAIVNPHRAA